MKPWFRVYNSILNDPKILGLSLDNQAIFVKLLAVSNLHNSGGSLPKLEVISKIIGVRVDKVRTAIASMVAAELIDEDKAESVLTIHGWCKRQYESDDANARSRRHRSEKCNVAPYVAKHQKRNGAKTSPRAGATDSDSDTDKKDPPFFPPLGIVRPDSGDVEPLPAATPTSASTPEQIARVRSMAWERFGGLTSGDVWINRVVQYCFSWPAEWIELLIPIIASKLIEPDGQWLPETYAKTTLNNWTRRGGPPDRVYADGAGGKGAATVEAPGRARPATEHQRKMARVAEMRKQLEQEAEREQAESEGLGSTGDAYAHGAAQSVRRA